MRKSVVTRILTALVLSIAPMCASAQAYTTVSGSTVQSGFGVPLTSGAVCFQPITTATGAIATITPQGGPSQSAPFCSTVTAGSFSFATVPNLTTATPTGITYTLNIYNGSSVLILALNGVSVTGSTWSFDTYTVGTASYPSAPSAYGIGLPYSTCAVGASYTRLDPAQPQQAGWTCALNGGPTIWFQSGSGIAPIPPTLTVTVPIVAQMIASSSTAAGVTDVNSITGHVGLVAGSNITLTPSGHNITIAASAGGTPPTGSGFVHITSGTQDGAARAINLATGDVTGVLPGANIQNPLNQSTTGNAATASAFDHTPGLCSTGQAPTGVLANGNATGCAAIGGGSGAFSSLTGGTNTGAAMVVGTGASIGTSGAGTIAATTSAALAATPTLCSTGNAPTGILANGNSTGCASISGGGSPGGSSGDIQFNSSGSFGGSNLHQISGNLQVGSGTPTVPFAVNGHTFFGDYATTNPNPSQDPYMTVNRTYAGQTGTYFAHAYTDDSTWNCTGCSASSAIASYDSRTSWLGAIGTEHYVGFQSIPFVGSTFTGTINRLIGTVFSGVINCTACTVNSLAALEVDDYTTSSSFHAGVNYGIHVLPLSNATDNWGIHVDSNDVFFGGHIVAGTSGAQINSIVTGGRPAGSYVSPNLYILDRPSISAGGAFVEWDVAGVPQWVFGQNPNSTDFVLGSSLTAIDCPISTQICDFPTGATAITLATDTHTGAAGGIILAPWVTAGTYNCLSMNGNCAATTMVGWVGGATVDPGLYGYVPTGGLYGFNVNGSLAGKLDAVGWNLPNGTVYGWGASGTNDTGCSRDSAVVIDCGNGSQGSKTATLNVATLNATTAVTTANVTDSALTSGNCVQASTAGILTTTPNPCIGLHSNYWNVQGVLYANSTMLGPIFYEPIALPIDRFTVRTSGTTSCTTNPTVELMDLGTSASTSFGSATNIVGLAITGSVTDIGGLGITSVAGHFYGIGFLLGACVTPPNIDVTVHF